MSKVIMSEHVIQLIEAMKKYYCEGFDLNTMFEDEEFSTKFSDVSYSDIAFALSYLKKHKV